MRSTLELRIGGLPYPHGEAGGWRYRHALRPEGVSDADRQVVVDFVAYEAIHGRAVSVIADAALDSWKHWGSPASRPVPGSWPTPCCTHVYPAGCGQLGLLCHGTPVAALEAILKQGRLRSSESLTGRSPESLAANSTWGEPADYFRFVMLANAACTAPEAVALSRVLGRDLVPSDLHAGYPPAARLYFTWDLVSAWESATFDGVHPIKLRDEIALDEALVVAVVPWRSEPITVPRRYAERVVRLDGGEDIGPERWATACGELAAQRAG